MKRFLQLLAIIIVLAVPFLLTPLFGQNPRSVITTHPRLLMNDTVPDTWEPGKPRLTAVQQRAFGAASADLASLKKLASSANPTFYNANDEGALNSVLAYAMLYAIYHKAGQDSTANPYAEALWNTMSSSHVSSPVYYITSITTDSSGIATATLSSAPNPPITPGVYHFAVWGAKDDALCGPVNVVSVPSPTTLTYRTTVKNASVTDSGMLGSTTLTGVDQTGQVGRVLAQWSYFYDWCNDWLVANGHDQYARDQIKAVYWSSTLTRSSSQFNNSVRESDFHNYTSWLESGIMEAGLALFGDDPLGATMLNEGAGYLWEGIQINPAACCSETYEYNLKKSVDALTGGAMNWEGPTYWRAGTIRFLRAIEAFDSATARRNNIWVSQFPTVKNAGMYKVYLRNPAGGMAAFGDGGNAGVFAGRDNFGLAILNDRFPDPHFVWMMNNDSPSNWDSGSGGVTGLVYKLLFYPYVNGPGSHDSSDLPLAAQFGPDLILRSGWGPTDTFITYSSSLKGVYHRHDDAGTFTLFKNSPLVQSQPYTIIDNVYNNYNRRTIGGNTLTIFDPADCWKDNSPSCGVDAAGNKLVNDGGQLRTLRRYFHEFNSYEFQISRIWSGSLYSDGKYSNVYKEVSDVGQPNFAIGTGYEHIKQDLTSAYRNSHAGEGDNPHAKVAANNGVIRELVHFQATYGKFDPLVIFDQVSAMDANFKKSWLIHTVNAPTVNGAQPGPGDTTTNNATLTTVDNDTGRLFVSHVLPASPNVRAVGGNACTPVPIQSATNGNPAVYYAPSHGLKAGESVRMDTGTVAAAGTNSQWWPNWLFDRTYGSSCGFTAVASVPDPDHFTISGCGSNSSTYQPWSTAFTSGRKSPGGAGAFAGQVYYQTDARAGKTVWQWTGSDWVNLADTGRADPFGYTSPVIYSHSSCNWSYHVDQLGPQGSGGANLWEVAMDAGPANTLPNWLVAESPSSSNATDYFLNVLTATTTSVNSPPATKPITTGKPTITTLTQQDARQASGRDNRVYGVLITDTGGSYIAVFSASAGGTMAMDYSAQHTGFALHVASGLVQGKYIVMQNGQPLPGEYTARKDGTISFKEKGGGDFRITSAVEGGVTAKALQP
jgi:hypothetical protein